ncbi:MAG: indolepyruvate ferredoxin oxidoreductase family protein [Alphaproteobacteria bacterium]|jgi:indolepyruvate ferredoxin oxidoreductase|nr:indolepyruvate ferredoxin oxidoreductase family protein [Alphaproteobacteria bacterium]
MNAPLRDVTLDDKYTQEAGPIYLTGSQALVRLALNQLRRDEVAGLETACFISGYRGSPMHNVDKELWRAGRLVAGQRIHFQPGVNEDLAATSCWGSQQANMYPGARHDGVFAIWYGKGPGLDRSIDAIRHANLGGTSAHGGVLAVVGDDPAMKSTDVPAASETMFADLLMPMLYPATVQEILDYGHLGWEMSRFSGAWTGFKLTAETVDAAAVVDGGPERLRIVRPNFELPPDGVSIRADDVWLDQEPRLRRYKLPAALAFARANEINRRIIDGPGRRLGIIASGKTAMDVRQALKDLGLDDKAAAEAGISFLKIGMPFPLDAETVRSFADGLEEILVVEEKRRFMESRVRDALYDMPEGRRPRVVGRYDEAGGMLLPECGEFGADEIAVVLAGRLARFHESERFAARLAFLDAKAERLAGRSGLEIARIPYFCSGCPHNTSTRVPEGSQAQGGVGCHYMSTYMERNTGAHTHMGGEGANWIGNAPFTETRHVFQNLGDGTYFHSGLLAIRACVAADVNITYKILFNDAVAMTGGQPHDGTLTPMAISAQVHAEGVKKIVVVTDEPDKYAIGAAFAPGTRIEHRRELDRVQRELRETPGVTVLIYDQTCAAEKRRRRKRGEMVDPPRRMFINHRVCEACGDCSRTSNCLSVLPLTTALGPKRVIDQSSCNKDYSCAEGFCPSFVNVIGARPRSAAGGREVPRELALLPEPTRPVPAAGESFDILVTGIGGTGVVTIAALLTMAAHMEGKAFSTIDQFGMAQKGGAVTSHVRIAGAEDDLGAVRLGSGDADLILGCDSLVTGSELALTVIDPARTSVVLNTHQAITGQFALNPDLAFPASALETRVRAEADADKVHSLNATRLATLLLGDAIASNLFMLGFAYQKGLVPVSAAALAQAIELNGLAVEMNKAAFEWGRRATHDLSAVEAEAESGAATAERVPESLEAIVAHRTAELGRYQDAAYAQRYESLVRRVAAAAQALSEGAPGLAETVARNLYKLMAYKDEYEVARLYSEPTFAQELEARFEGIERLELLLAPPLLSRPDPLTGAVRKRTFGPWIFPALRWLARLKGLRGSALDPFGRTEERRTERALIADYEAIVEELLGKLDPGNRALAVAIAEVPATIRGFGHVKAANVVAARAEWERLMAAWRSDQPVTRAAE